MGQDQVYDLAALTASLDDGMQLGGQLGATMGIEFISGTIDEVVAIMPVTGNTQALGILHGGASCALAESVGSIAAGLAVGPERYVVGLELHATHHRKATPGQSLTAVARPIQLGNTVTTHGIVITDEQDARICTVQLTCIVRDR